MDIGKLSTSILCKFYTPFAKGKLSLNQRYGKGRPVFTGRGVHYKLSQGIGPGSSIMLPWEKAGIYLYKFSDSLE